MEHGGLQLSGRLFTITFFCFGMESVEIYSDWAISKDHDFDRLLQRNRDLKI